MLFHRPVSLAKPDFLKFIWKQNKDSKGNGGAPGIDNQSAPNFSKKLDLRLLQLREELLSGLYGPTKLKMFSIPKGTGKHRIICIPTVKDRLVQRAILTKLFIEKDRFKIKNPNSFGVLRGQGNQAAVKKTIKLREIYPWVLKADIVSFFDKVDRKKLKKIISGSLGKTHSLVRLLEKIIDCEIKYSGSGDYEIAKKNGIVPNKGLRQGMPLSPALSSVLLRGFDRKLIKQNLVYIRYVDDLIIFSKTKEHLEDILKFITKELEKLFLEVHDLSDPSEKTKIHTPDEAVEFLGVEIFKAGSNYKFKIPSKSKKQIMTDFEQFKSFTYCQKEGLTFQKLGSLLENKIRGYSAAYKGAENLTLFLNDLKQAKLDIQKNLLEGILGSETVKNLSINKKRFLGIE